MGVNVNINKEEDNQVQITSRNGHYQLRVFYASAGVLLNLASPEFSQEHHRSKTLFGLKLELYQLRVFSTSAGVLSNLAGVFSAAIESQNVFWYY
jgi:hypothetical protein